MLPTTQKPKQGIPAWVWLVGATVGQQTADEHGRKDA